MRVLETLIECMYQISHRQQLVFLLQFIVQRLLRNLDSPVVYSIPRTPPRLLSLVSFHFSFHSSSSSSSSSASSPSSSVSTSPSSSSTCTLCQRRYSDILCYAVSQDSGQWMGGLPRKYHICRYCIQNDRQRYGFTSFRGLGLVHVQAPLPSRSNPSPSIRLPLKSPEKGKGKEKSVCKNQPSGQPSKQPHEDETEPKEKEKGKVTLQGQGNPHKDVSIEKRDPLEQGIQHEVQINMNNKGSYQQHQENKEKVRLTTWDATSSSSSLSPPSTHKTINEKKNVETDVSNEVKTLEEELSTHSSTTPSTTTTSDSTNECKAMVPSGLKKSRNMNFLKYHQSMAMASNSTPTTGTSPVSHSSFSDRDITKIHSDTGSRSLSQGKGQ